VGLDWCSSRRGAVDPPRFGRAAESVTADGQVTRNQLEGGVRPRRLSVSSSEVLNCWVSVRVGSDERRALDSWSVGLCHRVLRCALCPTELSCRLARRAARAARGSSPPHPDVNNSQPAIAVSHTHCTGLHTQPCLILAQHAVERQLWMLFFVLRSSCARGKEAGYMRDNGTTRYNTQQGEGIAEQAGHEHQRHHRALQEVLNLQHN
jgi:hypothetical protein